MEKISPPPTPPWDVNSASADFTVADHSNGTRALKREDAIHPYCKTGESAEGKYVFCSATSCGACRGKEQEILREAFQRAQIDEQRHARNATGLASRSVTDKPPNHMT